MEEAHCIRHIVCHDPFGGIGYVLGAGAVFLCRHGSDYLLFPQADEGRLPASALRIVAGAVAEWRNGDVPVPDYAFAIVRMGTASLGVPSGLVIYVAASCVFSHVRMADAAFGSEKSREDALLCFPLFRCGLVGVNIYSKKTAKVISFVGNGRNFRGWRAILCFLFSYLCFMDRNNVLRGEIVK